MANTKASDKNDKRTPDDIIDDSTCFFNRGVACVHALTAPRGKCLRCGWNPDVEQHRKAELRKKYR